ncbi:MAG: MMPL family transporter, partial [Methylococcales bacterium]|nr:MMPL family transporter [Methylococcales bacterium]
DLSSRLKTENEYVQSVYIPGEGAFFERQGLTFLELDDLETLAANLAEAQPFIGRLYQDSSLIGFLSTIILAITRVDHELPIDLKSMIANITAAIMAVNKGDNFQLSWQQLMFGDETDLLTTQRFILVKPNIDFGELLPAEKSLRAIRTITEKTKALFPQVSIRVTGEVALEHDELESVAQSMVIASLVSLFLVCAALLIGRRSLSMMFATLVSLVMGLIFTAAFAALTIGHLNLISVAFSVLYIGLGVDYAIHLCLRYRELLQEKYSKEQALSLSIRTIAPSLALCALTTSAAFYAFVPTAYEGVSELGIIAGTGMFIALIISLIVLPAILKILPVFSIGP